MKLLPALGLFCLLTSQADASIISGWSTYSYSFSGPGVEDGGLGVTSASTDNNTARGHAFSSATLTGLNNTPVLKSYAESATSVGFPAENFAYSETFGVQGFTYSGAASTTLTLDLLLDVTYTPGLALPNKAVAEARVALIRASSLDFYPDYPTLIYEIAPFNSLVDNADMFFFGNGNIISNQNSVSIDVDQGDDFFVVSYLMTKASDGEIVDASHTFTMEFTDNTDLAAASINAVPVPAAAWLFASGLIGLVAAARRK